MGNCNSNNNRKKNDTTKDKTLGRKRSATSSVYPLPVIKEPGSGQKSVRKGGGEIGIDKKQS